jgi:hypothetical protein
VFCHSNRKLTSTVIECHCWARCQQSCVEQYCVEQKYDLCLYKICSLVVHNCQSIQKFTSAMKNYISAAGFDQSFFFFFFFELLEFELRSPCLQDRCITNWAMYPALFGFVIFQVGSFLFVCFFVWLGLGWFGLQSYSCLLCYWDYRYASTSSFFVEMKSH